MNLEEIRHALREAGLERLAEQVERLTLPAIRIDVQPADEGELPIGASKIGGRPDLPPDVAWPEHNGTPMGFLAQFNLAEVAPYDVEHVLPPAGMLYFFYDFVAAPWGLEPDDRGGWRVLYAETDQRLLRRASAPSRLAPGILRPCVLTFSEAATLEQDSWMLDPLSFTQEEFRHYEQLRDVSAYFRNHLLGHPLIIHHDLLPLQCELVANAGSGDGFYDLMIRPTELWDEQAKENARCAYENWRLLFQLGHLPETVPSATRHRLDEVPQTEDSWPYCSIWERNEIMYFWIERDRLARGDFSKVWLLGASEF